MPKVAAIQMCSSTNVGQNLKMAAHLIMQAVESGAELVVLPEMFAVMGVDTAGKSKYREAYGEGQVQDFLAQQSKQHQIWLVGGTIPIVADHPDKIRAACLVYTDQGEVAARYDKIHLFDVAVNDKEAYQESATTEAGSELIVVDTPVGRLGLAVCYDIRFPETFTELMSRGAELIAVPAAFTAITGKAHWDVLTRCRALDSFCYIVASCQGGRHPGGRKTYGHSRIIDPWGVPVQKISNNRPGVIVQDIDLSYLAQVRQRIPTGRHYS